MLSSRLGLWGNGAVVVPDKPLNCLERAAGQVSGMRKISVKAGPNRKKRSSRGSAGKEVPKRVLRAMTIKEVANLKNLVLAYELIKSKPGNMTPGVNMETLDGISKEYLLKVQAKLLAGKYEFPAARRVEIPKPGKPGETRPLTIASPRDKLVQKAMQLIMEPHYEEQFSASSHGFRPGRGTHTAVLQVDAQLQSAQYIVEADFSKAFDSISHSKLMEIIARHISDEKLLRLIRSGLKSGWMDRFGELHDNLGVGTPQGSILSPLLCNIFLHELDIFMETLKAKHEKGVKKGRNKEHESLTNKVKWMRTTGKAQTERERYRDLLKKMLLVPSQTFDDNYVRINYVRYADDFIIGVQGSLTIAQQVLAEVSEFVTKELGLKLNDSKTGIVPIKERACGFLGYLFRAPYKAGSSRGTEVIREPNSQRLVRRRKKERMSIFMDYQKVLKRLEQNKFIRLRKRPGSNDETMLRGTFRGNLINLDHADILRYYNSVIRGIYNYYCTVNNMSKVARVI